MADVLKKVVEKLNCSICHQTFSQPKYLPCFHAFCKDCLGQLHCVYQGDNCMVKCPTCRFQACVPKKGIAGFPDMHRFSDYIDLQKPLEKMVENDPVICEGCSEASSEGYCPHCECFFCRLCTEAHNRMAYYFVDHEVISNSKVIENASQLKPLKKPPVLKCTEHDKPLDIYCHSPCDKLICLECVARDHQGHDSDPISDERVFARYNQEITDHLQTARKKLAFISNKVVELQKRKTAIEENRDHVQQEIRAAGEQLKATVQKSMDELERRAKAGMEEKLRVLNAKMEEAEMEAAVLQSRLDFVERGRRR